MLLEQEHKPLVYLLVVIVLLLTELIFIMAALGQQVALCQQLVTQVK
jgi:hypothetical protein